MKYLIIFITVFNTGILCEISYIASLIAARFGDFMGLFWCTGGSVFIIYSTTMMTIWADNLVPKRRKTLVYYVPDPSAHPYR